MMWSHLTPGSDLRFVSSFLPQSPSRIFAVFKTLLAFPDHVSLQECVEHQLKAASCVFGSHHARSRSVTI